MSSLKDKINDLYVERSRLSNQLSTVNSEIGRLQRECTHAEEDVRYDNEMELERWNYTSVYEYDPSGQHVAEKRSAYCTCCRFSWSELRFRGFEWQEATAWQRDQDEARAKRQEVQ